MNFLTEYFNSGSIKTQNMKRLGALLICITAALLVISLAVLSIASLVNAAKGNNPGDEDDEEGTGGISVPTGYTTTTLDPALIKAGNLLQIDANNPYNGTPTNLKIIGPERAKNQNGEVIYYAHNTVNYALTAETMEALNKMMLAFYEETQNTNVYVSAAYDQSAANQISALHATATAITLHCYTEAPAHATIYGVEEYEWIYEHAHEYGFVRASSKQGEEDIFRYVGVAHAMGMDKLNKTDFADYLELLRTRYNKPSAALSVSVDGKTQRIYYQSAEAPTVIVPTKWEYTLSGDNVNGYIITVDTSAQIKQN